MSFYVVVWPFRVLFLRVSGFRAQVFECVCQRFPESVLFTDSGILELTQNPRTLNLKPESLNPKP